MRNLRRTAGLLAGLMVAVAATGGGCVALAVGAAAGVGTYAYIKGELTDVEEATLDRSYEAAQAAVKDLEFKTKDQAKDAISAHVDAVEADGTEVKIKMESKGEKLTKFYVRVGVFGDESKSRLIMDKIKKHV